MFKAFVNYNNTGLFSPITTFRRYVHLKKSYGQHLLIDKSVLHKIHDSCDITKNDVVLEIGPGTGNLTSILLSTSKSVICIEKDKQMITPLGNRFSKYLESGSLHVINADILDWKCEYSPTCCVSNIPYYISSSLLYKFILDPSFWFLKGNTLLVQKEFAQKICASENDSIYRRLSILTQYLYKPQLLFDVPPSAFMPPPEVTSSVLKLEPIRWDTQFLGNKDKKQKLYNFLLEFNDFLRILFLRKNRNVKSNLTHKYSWNQDLFSALKENKFEFKSDRTNKIG
ncbi:hypothetical protein WA158_000994 [Blastocystis sp. Blastoise]